MKSGWSRVLRPRVTLVPKPTADQTPDPSTELDQLAEDHQDFKLRTSPTWAHMIGEYRYADRFDDVSRAAEESQAAEARAIAARAEAIDAEALDDQRRITRAVVTWDATSRAELLDGRTEEFGADPIFGVQSALSVYIPKLALPTVNIDPMPPERVKTIRKAVARSTREFERRFGIPEATVNNWEQGRRKPDPSARVLLTVIERDPKAVERALHPA